MPHRQKVMGAAAALGLMLLLAGCGGPKNPVRTANQTPPFFDGWWDGFWQIPVFVWRLITTGHTYSVHIIHASPAYNVGWIVGMIVFFVLVATVVSSFGEVARGFLVGVAVVFVIALIYGLVH